MPTHHRFAELFTPAPARRPVREALADWMPVARMMGLDILDEFGIGSVRVVDGNGIGEVREVDGEVAWSGEPDIPDSDVYLHDDWGDGKLTSRDDSGTTTYNGVEGVYRPEWATDEGSPGVTNQQIHLTGGDAARADINLNLSETVTWVWDHDISNGGTAAGDLLFMQCFSESTSVSISDWGQYHSGYGVGRRRDSGTCVLRGVASDGSLTTIISGTASDESEIKVTRTASGTWELFADDVSQGTATDTTHTNPQYIGFGVDSTGAGDVRVNELKVN